jgi:hypothetical protein
MKVLDRLEVHCGNDIKQIELLSGDLTNIPPEHAVDVLIVSAFPNDYVPTSGSLIGALSRKGLSVAALARNRQQDLTQNFSCWLSHPVRLDGDGLRFRRILCFEPLRKGRPSEVVDDIFRALAPFAFEEPHVRSVAMPIVAAGDQGNSETEMVRALLSAAHRWLQEGFPLRTIKLVIYERNPTEAIRGLFRHEAGRLEISTSMTTALQEEPLRYSETVAKAPLYDVFISYSRADETPAQHFHDQLLNAGLRVFMDRSAIQTGASWLQSIFDALAACRLTAVLYSPDFLKSKPCQDEFNISWIKRYDSGRDALFPLLLRDAEIPPHMRMLNYVDCRINDNHKIAIAAERLAAILAPQKGKES